MADPPQRRRGHSRTETVTRPPQKRESVDPLLRKLGISRRQILEGSVLPTPLRTELLNEHRKLQSKANALKYLKNPSPDHLKEIELGLNALRKEFKRLQDSHSRQHKYDIIPAEMELESNITKEREQVLPSFEGVDSKQEAQALLVAGIAMLDAQRDFIEQQEIALVTTARAHGLSWTDVAEPLGISRQSAHRKYDPKGRDYWKRKLEERKQARAQGDA